jgi:hypothetical protein
MASSVLAPVQERGRAALEQLGLPNRRQEPWRLTDLKRLAAVSELPASASPLSTPLPASLMILWPSRGFRKESRR